MTRFENRYQPIPKMEFPVIRAESLARIGEIAGRPNAYLEVVDGRQLVRVSPVVWARYSGRRFANGVEVFGPALGASAA